MQTFGKTMRNSLPALGLGLLSAFAVASVAAVTAPVAIAQKVTAKKEFVENFNAASAALSAKRYSEALSKADAAAPHAEGSQQKSAIEQIRVGATCAGTNHQGCVTAIEKARSVGGLPAAVQQNYDKMLAGKYDALGQSAKAAAQTKANIDKYGGSATELQYIARKELDAKNYGEAVKYAQKAVDAKGGGTAYNIMLNAYSAQGKMDDYYKVVERIAPAMKQDTYWRMLIERTKKEPKFKSQEGLLDVYRALTSAGVKLNTQEQKEMAEMALNRGMAIEAEKIWAPLFKAGTLGGASDKDAARNKRLYDLATTEAKADKATDLAKSETDAATKATGDAYASTAESWLGSGDNTKAIDLFQKALAKGNMDAGATDFVKLRLGIAQFKGGKKADATKTWQSIKADNGAGWLAKSWLAIAKS
jgi:tetratricopeptide (TPR) repeat protein